MKLLSQSEIARTGQHVALYRAVLNRDAAVTETEPAYDLDTLHQDYTDAMREYERAIKYGQPWEIDYTKSEFLRAKQAYLAAVRRAAGREGGER